MTPHPPRPTSIAHRRARFTRATTAAALLLAASLPLAAQAQDVTWASPVSGEWQDALNWLPPELSPPSSRDVSAAVGQSGDPAFQVLLTDRRDVAGFALLATGATLIVQPEARLSLGRGGLRHEGLIRLRDRATLMFFHDGAPTVGITGAGVVRLEGRQAELGADAALAVDLAPGASVRGRGKITAGLRVRGEVLADDPDGDLVLEGPAKTNDGSIGAAQGGTLTLNGVSVHQGPSGSIAAHPGGLVLLDGATLIGGSLTGLGGTIVVQTAGTLDGVSLVGDVGIPGGTSLGVVGAALAHTGGTIAVGGGGPVAGLSDFFCYEPLTLAGSGTIALRPAVTPEGGVIQPRITLGAPGTGAAITLADGYTLTGSGDIIGGLRIGTPGTADAFLSPGTADAPGLLWIDGTLELAPTGLATFDIFGPAACDRVVSTGHAVIAGRVVVNIAPGVVLTPGTSCILLEAPSLDAASAVLIVADVPGQPRGRIVVTPSSIEFRVPLCPADFDASGALDPDDLASFIEAYFSGAASAALDVDGNGTVNPDDLSDMVAAYFAGC